MSSIKCVGTMAAATAVIAGGLSAYNGIKRRNAMIADAQKIADSNGGKIPTGGMTKDGKLWDGFTTVDDVKKNSKKAVILGSALAAGITAGVTAVISGLTLLAKSKLVK